MNHSGEAKMIVALRSILPAVMLACMGAEQTAAQPVCKPALTVKQVGFSEMINLRRIWTASIDVDASRCTTNERAVLNRLHPPFGKCTRYCFHRTVVLAARAKAGGYRVLGRRSGSALLDRRHSRVPLPQ